MSNEKDQSLDVFGVKPLSKTIDKTLEGVGKFLGKICMPAAEEFGLMLKERVSQWRMSNFAEIANGAESIMGEQGGIGNRSAHPRIVSEIMEEGSWIDDSDVQEMWSGLLASSCTQEGRDESNLIFINLLSELTTAQAKILKYACTNTEKKLSSNGFVYAEELNPYTDKIIDISGVRDIHRIDRELDHLRSLELIDGGGSFPKFDDPEYREMVDDLDLEREDDRGKLNLTIEPTPLALNLYVRSQGLRQSPVDFFDLVEK